MNSQATNNTSKEQEQEQEQEQLRSVQVAVPTMAPNANTTVMATPSHPHLIRSPPLTPYTPLSPRPITFSYKWICAPMVNASELAFRMMLRTSTPSILCYSPMIDVHRYLTDSSYHDVFTTCHTDRPLIIQLGGHDIDEMIKVGKMLQSQCDAIDINLGCPQRHARTHMYGAFLCDAPYRTHLIELIRRMRIELDVPITAKIRLQSTLHETLHLIHDLETCGVSLITIHGRTKGSVEQRRHGPANLDMIRDIIPSTSIPIITNGNVRCAADVIANLTYTHAHGIMVAEELLHQPLLFAQVEEMERQLSLSPTCTPSLPSSLTDSILLAHSYLSYASKYDTPYHIIHGHIYRIVHDDLFRFQLRREFAECPDLDTLHLHLLLLQQRRDSGTYKYDRAKHIQDKEWYASGFKLKRKRDGEEEIKQIQIQTQTQTKTQKKRIRTDASQEEQKEPSKDMSTQPVRLTSKQRCRLRQKQAAAAKRQEKLADAAAAAAVANATATTSTSTSTSTSLSPSDSISSSSSHLDAIT